MEIKEIETFVKDMCERHGWKLDPKTDFDKFIEEVGEMAREMRRIKEGRQRPDEVEPEKEVMIEHFAEEAGDVIFAFVKILMYYGVTLEESFLKHKEKMIERYEKKKVSVKKEDYDQYMERLLKKAEEIATEAHKGQVDKGGNDYIEHPRRVADRMLRIEDKIVAWLHDVPEDTDWTLDDLRKAGFPDFIVEAVDSITKRENETRAEYYHRLVQNSIGRRVKIYGDIQENMDLTRIPNYTKKDEERVENYKRTCDLLQNAGITYFYVPNEQGEKVWKKLL